jgi:ParB family transcriptional regulator, chromosome partitioning protein
MEIHKVSVDAISAEQRMRQINSDRVAALAESIKTIGLQTPISVWSNDDGSEVRLVAGAHRLAAVKSLGWEEVACSLVDMDEIDRQLWEIAENLHRAELDALERSNHIAEWVRLTEKRRKEREENQPLQVATPEVGYKKPPPQKESGQRAASRELGIELTKVHRAVKIASIPEEAKEAAAAAGLSDNQSALERVARADDAVAEVGRIVEEREARKAPEPEARWTHQDESTYAALLDAWEGATQGARDSFRRWVRHAD